PGDHCWWDIALDPDGIHFWAPDTCFGTLYKFVINPNGGGPILGPISVSDNAVGVCVKGDPPCVRSPGSPPGCDDGDPCTDDTCDPAVGCVHVPTVACD